MFDDLKRGIYEILKNPPFTFQVDAAKVRVANILQDLFVVLVNKAIVLVSCNKNLCVPV